MKSIIALCWIILLALPTWCDPENPIHVSHPESVSINFVTFVNDLHPENRIGYRIHEHLPLIAGQTPKTNSEAKIEPDETKRLILEFSKSPGVYRVDRPVTEEGWIPQDWTFYFAPTIDGIEILWVVKTKELGLPEFYSAQQCFRMSGKTNADWRRKIAETPAFSEYDFWAALEKQKQPFKSLSYFRVAGDWVPFPAIRKKTLSRTPLGRNLEEAAGFTEEAVSTILDPQHPADFIVDSENGPMTRLTLERDWLSGIYWEGMTHLSNHHPADCLHAIVNLGSIPPNSQRAIKGKIYWMQGNLQDLLAHWRKDFAQ